MRILFVAMTDSIHAARWINLVSQHGWDIHIFEANYAVPNVSLKNGTVYTLSSFRREGLNNSVHLKGIWPSCIGTGLLRRFIRDYYPHWAAHRLTRLIQRIKPDVVHSLEMQHAAYLTLEAKNQLKGQFPLWIVSNWGSDIYLFGRLSSHVERVMTVLSECDYYTSECHRDVELARSHGFEGKVLPVLPSGGGFDLKQMLRIRQPGQPSARRSIMLKGYQHWAGRALVGLHALSLLRDVLQGYHVAVYSANNDVKIAAELTSQKIGVPIEVVPPTSHEDILRLHGRARISIGLSIGDAIPTSLLEAMVMGSFPIQSNTSCANEWISDGETGLIVEPEDPIEVAAAIRLSLTNDALVDEAAELNARVARELLDYNSIQRQVIAIYQGIQQDLYLGSQNLNHHEGDSK
jgi:hypothetical protein